MSNAELNSLEAMLEGQQAAQNEVSAAEPVAEKTDAQAQGEKTTDAGPPPGSDENDQSALVPRKALIEERRKRQDFEKKVAEFEARFAQLSHPQPVPQQPYQAPQPPDPWTDPEGALAFERQQRELQLYETRVLLSEEMMSQKPDYEDAKRVFIEAANADPNLAQQLVRHPLPAKFVYEQGKRLAAMREIGPDPAAYREQLRQQLRDELLTEMQTQPQSFQSSTPRAPAPKSLAGNTSAQPRDPKGRYASGPASLEELLGG